jgi:hypothetical protein
VDVNINLMQKNNSKPILKLDWATHEAAKYACENWHYSGCVPVNKTVKVGVWENSSFIGVVIFSCGASANLYKSYSIPSDRACELTRVALTRHKTPVSKILSIAIKFLVKNSPNIELIISFADTEQGHHGGIYQATNWIYTGKTTAKNLLFFFKNRWVHNRTIREMLGSAKFSKAKRECWFKTKETSEKHRYLMPLKNRKKYEKLSKPYPKRTKHSSDAPTIPSGRGQCDSDLCAPIK